MKYFFKVPVFLEICIFLISCGQSVTPTSSPTPSLTATTTVTITPVPSQTATATIKPTPRPEYVPPTLIPTIDPTLVPGLLSEAFSIQTIEGVNGHKIRQITGWDYGFRRTWPSGYWWLDSNHLILYPVVGQEPGMSAIADDLAPQPVVINRNTGNSWLPNPRLVWSRELGILITSGTYNDKSAIFTYTLDGKRLAYYPGALESVSPSGTKILVGEDTLIDLRANKKINLVWPKNEDKEPIYSGLYWTYDETRVYRCCYYYADISTGASYRFEVTDLQTTDGRHVSSSMLPFVNGEWVQNDTLFLVEWSYIDDGDIRYLPMFDPAEKIFYDVREMAGISEDWTCLQTRVSPDGMYVWMRGEETSYLVNLSTFEAVPYNMDPAIDFNWSSDSKFAWLWSSSGSSDANLPSPIHLLSISNKRIEPLNLDLLFDSFPSWHPTDNVLAYISEDAQKLEILNVQSISNQELTLPSTFRNLIWSPSGESIALAAKDGSLWQVDYPKLENLEQLTPSLPDVHSLNWSPDSNSLAFVSATDIYIVDTNK